MRTSDRSRTSIRQKIFFSALALVGTALIVLAGLFILLFSGTTQRLVEQLAREVNKQIVFNFERYIDSVFETGNYLQAAILSSQLPQDEDSLSTLFSVNSDLKRDLVTSAYLDRGDNLLVSDSPDISLGAINSATLSRARSLPEIYHFFVGLSINRFVARDDEVLIITRALRPPGRSGQDSGVLYLEFDTSVITELAGNTNLGESGHILILDDRDSLVYSSIQDQYSAASFREVEQRYLGGFAARLLDRNMFININTLSGTRWRIVTVNNIDSISQVSFQFIWIIAAVFVISLFVTAVIAGLISVRISRPIQDLQDSMAQVESGDLSANISLRGQQEIVDLSDSFNRMIGRTRELMDSLVQEQREKRKTELRALQNQINPHFLYNALDSIVWLAEHDRQQDVITTVVALARFFRISISRGANFIPVATELEHALNYLTIQQIRYVDRFDYEIDVPGELKDIQVMKLILQPLLENAIHYGLGDERGHIRITGTLEGEILRFDVENSGYGLSEAGLSEIREIITSSQEGRGVGLRNVYQRLQLYYGETADLRISSVADESTTVSLIIPLRPGDRPEGRNA